MTKFLNTMLATVAVVAVTSVAHADAVTNVAKGAYLGVSAGVANSNVKYSAATSGTMGLTGGNTSQANEVFVRKATAGKTAGLFGVVAGYNLQSGSVVFGGEIYGGLDSTKVTVLDDTSSASSADAAIYGQMNVKRQRFFGFAPRVGFMVAPNTLMYARLGMEVGKWKAIMTPNQTTIDAAGTSPTLKADSKQIQTASKGGLSFAPGVGMEVYMGKAFLRAQYSYLFGPKVNLQQNIKGFDQVQYNGEYVNHSMKMSQHKVEMAVGYKF
jgi:hypothetical protein